MEDSPGVGLFKQTQKHESQPLSFHPRVATSGISGISEIPIPRRVRDRGSPASQTSAVLQSFPHLFPFQGSVHPFPHPAANLSSQHPLGLQTDHAYCFLCLLVSLSDFSDLLLTSMGADTQINLPASWPETPVCFLVWPGIFLSLSRAEAQPQSGLGSD